MSRRRSRRKLPAPDLPDARESTPLTVRSFKLSDEDIEELDRLAEDHGYKSRNAVVRAWLEASRSARRARRKS